MNGMLSDPSAVEGRAWPGRPRPAPPASMSFETAFSLLEGAYRAAQ